MIGKSCLEIWRENDEGAVTAGVRQFMGAARRAIEIVRKRERVIDMVGEVAVDNLYVKGSEEKWGGGGGLEGGEQFTSYRAWMN